MDPSGRGLAPNPLILPGLSRAPAQGNNYSAYSGAGAGSMPQMPSVSPHDVASLNARLRVTEQLYAELAERVSVSGALSAPQRAQSLHDSLDSRLRQMEARLGALSAAAGGENSQTLALLHRLEARVTTLETTVGNVAEDVAALRTYVKDSNQRVSNIEAAAAVSPLHASPSSALVAYSSASNGADGSYSAAPASLSSIATLSSRLVSLESTLAETRRSHTQSLDGLARALAETTRNATAAASAAATARAADADAHTRFRASLAAQLRALTEELQRGFLASHSQIAAAVEAEAAARVGDVAKAARGTAAAFGKVQVAMRVVAEEATAAKTLAKQALSEISQSRSKGSHSSGSSGSSSGVSGIVGGGGVEGLLESFVAAGKLQEQKQRKIKQSQADNEARAEAEVEGAAMVADLAWPAPRSGNSNRNNSNSSNHQSSSARSSGNNGSAAAAAAANDESANGEMGELKGEFQEQDSEFAWDGVTDSFKVKPRPNQGDNSNNKDKDKDKIKDSASASSSKDGKDKTAASGASDRPHGPAAAAANGGKNDLSSLLESLRALSSSVSSLPSSSDSVSALSSASANIKQQQQQPVAAPASVKHDHTHAPAAAPSSAATAAAAVSADDRPIGPKSNSNSVSSTPANASVNANSARYDSNDDRPLGGGSKSSAAHHDSNDDRPIGGSSKKSFNFNADADADSGSSHGGASDKKPAKPSAVGAVSASGAAGAGHTADWGTGAGAPLRPIMESSQEFNTSIGSPVKMKMHN